MVQHAPVILASSSPYKRRLFERLGIDFQSQNSDVEECRKSGESPQQMAQRLALKKAQTVAKQVPRGYVVGSDQVIALGTRIFQKPGDRQRAIEQLKALEGETHRLLNSVCLVCPDDGIEQSTAVYEMVMRSLDEKQIRRYVDRDRPFDCAGAYRIESAGVRLFEATRGDDPTAIEGLPLTRVWTLLLRAGWSDE